MYTSQNIVIDGLQFLALQSGCGMSKAMICLDQGGRLSDFVFENIQILAPYQPASYKDNYASSVLFPFTNRLKDGEYSFNDSKYTLDRNEVDKNNALHGVVYNKKFTCIHSTLTSESASVSLQYKDDGTAKGFPFKFNLELTYTLNKSGINLSVNVFNEDEKPFPFSLGWHPYFKSEDLDNSAINFKSNTKYLFDQQYIISGTMPLDVEMPFHLKDVKLDDSYELETNEIEFATPAYGFKITSTSKDNFLHLYTPDQPNVISIEPMTGLGNSFNNNIGLQMLDPKGRYNVEWNVAIATVEMKIKANNRMVTESSSGEGSETRHAIDSKREAF